MGARGFDVRVVPVDANGVVDLDALGEAVGDKTGVVSVMAANNEVGTIQPVAACAQIARAAGAVFHTDAVQALPWIPVEAEHAELIALAAHKCGGPKGVGALIVRRGVGVEPIVHGGGQERGLRSGTYNVAGIAGFAAAVREVTLDREAEGGRVAVLRDRLQAAVLERIDGVHVHGDGAPRLPNNCNLGITGVESEPLLLLLDAAGLAASSGSACQSGASEPSHVLRAMKVDPAGARGALRLTLGRTTTEADVDAAVELVVTAVQRLRR
jgi:cysteine desulfurase